VSSELHAVNSRLNVRIYIYNLVMS
jgi:hypothetical protein